MKRNFTLGLFIILQNLSSAQTSDTVLFNTLGNFNFSFLYSGYTPLIDRLNRPYIYLATKELGVVTFDITSTMNPVPVDTIPKSAINNLKATGVAQDSNYLFISLGDFEGGVEKAGLAIFDITNPSSPVMVDEWDSIAFTKGTSSVILDGNYAYLSAMDDGVIILNVGNQQNIQFVSQIIPDLSFGNHNGTYHARGLCLNNDTLLVAYDNGGLRMIDVSNKQIPVEIGMYVNQVIDSIGIAYYNHVHRIGNIAYCAVDFCGFEAVDVSNPLVMQSVSWLNPWNCTHVPFPFGSWMGSDGHTNEIAYDAQHNILFFSGGDSQVLALDAGNPATPQIVGSWGLPNDSVGSWGIDVFNNLVAIANIHTLGFPFISIVGGLQLLNYQVITGLEQNSPSQLINIFPNPVSEKFIVEGVQFFNGDEIKIIDLSGRILFSKMIKSNSTQVEVEISSIRAGFYIIEVKSSNTVWVNRFIKSK